MSGDRTFELERLDHLVLRTNDPERLIEIIERREREQGDKTKDK